MPKLLRLRILIFLFALTFFNYAAAETRPTIAFGDTFPELKLTLTGKGHDRNYLGLGKDTLFTPTQIKADLLLVELINVHCVHCQMQVPSYNELFKLIESNPKTRGRIKMLAISLGNLPQEVETFRSKYQIPFPVLADPRFTAHRALGVSATPFSIYVRQNSSGQPGTVAKTHLGLNTDYRKVFAEIQQMLSLDPAELSRQGTAAVRKRTAITPLYADKELESLVRTAFINAGGRLTEFKRVDLRSGRRVYSALTVRGQKEMRLFAEVTSRQSVCDICHDVHFIYIFDKSTRILAFEPLQITKYGNVLWSDEDAERMRKRVLGQYLTAPRPFDPKIDAVSTATISSAIIFDSIAQGEGLLKELSDKGF